MSNYEVSGNTLLPAHVVRSIVVKYTGTNVGIAEIMKAGSELQMELRNRGYATVNVGIPPQQITNGTVRIQISEGQLTQILISNNRYFSSNNVMRALPGLHAKSMLLSPVFQAELDRANANQDRQIYPTLEPGPEENTTVLRLSVKDRLPLHSKFEINDQSSPGTPRLRFSLSGVYNNLWQKEHAVGVQYSFSPRTKTGHQWEFYDRPLVANYSMFYRMPLQTAEPLADVVEKSQGSFGYDEATRKFRLPPSSSGKPELSFFANRSTIDTGVTSLSTKTLQNIPGVLSISENDLQQDLTVNNAVGFRWSHPLPLIDGVQAAFSIGADFKAYEAISLKTNNFFFSITTVDSLGNPNPPTVSTVASPVPETRKSLDYLPLSLRYDASVRDSLGGTSVGLGLGGNLWFSGSSKDLQRISGSQKSTGHWLSFNPSLSRTFAFRTDWVLTLRMEGQWATEPLISNEQFGAGGVANVRGYSEGEVFGDTGYRASIEQKSPAFLLGMVDGTEPFTVRFSVYMDYAKVFLLDPAGRPARSSLWGTGFGIVGAIGFHWGMGLMVSVPLISTSVTEELNPRLNFSVNAQF